MHDLQQLRRLPDSGAEQFSSKQRLCCAARLPVQALIHEGPNMQWKVQHLQTSLNIFTASASKVALAQCTSQCQLEQLCMSHAEGAHHLGIPCRTVAAGQKQAPAAEQLYCDAAGSPHVSSLRINAPCAEAAACCTCWLSCASACSAAANFQLLQPSNELHRTVGRRCCLRGQDNVPS